MLIPYNVERPARRIPYVTYALMAINIFVFFVTVFVANLNLAEDRNAGKADIDLILKDTPKVRETVEELLKKQAEQDAASKAADEAASSDEESDNKASGDKEGDKKAEETPAAPVASNETTEEQIANLSPQGRKFLASIIAVREGTAEGYKKSWQIENSDATYVMEPHYSVLNLFAYRPGNNSIIGKLVGLLGSMFLHANLEHLLGNMLFLWVFGRAIEDSLGPRVYLGAYLLCGIAATLLYHFMTMQFAPSAMMVPSFGASGAIMGVLGLFAPRFYRTPVRAYFMPILLFAVGLFSGLLYQLTHDIGISSFFGLLIAGAILYAARNKIPWASRSYPAAYFLAAYIGYSDLYPAIRALTGGRGTDTGDGTAHWAHIGGFFFGILYAILIGAHKEGRQEFLIEDAEKAYNLGDIVGANTYAQNILEREPGNATAYEILGKSAMKNNNEEEALDHFETSVENYLRVGEREKAAALYVLGVEKYPLFILKPAIQLMVGNQLAKEYNFKIAAETLVKIPYTFPEAPEGEVALLRGAQLYLQHLNQPQTSLQLLQHFWQKHPDSQWMPQVERAWKIAQHQIELAEAEAQAANQESEIAKPSGPSRIQAVAPTGAPTKK